MRRIAYVCADPAVAVFGTAPASIRVQEMVRALQTLGAQVQLFAANLGGARPAGLEHVRVHVLSPLPHGQAAERERAAIRGNAELSWLLGDAGPFDIVYERSSLWSYAGMEFAASAHSASLLEVNAPLIEDEIEYRVLVDRDAAEQVARRSLRAAGAVLAASRGVARYLQHRFPETCSRISIVPPGIDAERFPPRAQPFEPRRAGAFTIGFVGTLEPGDGLMLLLDAFAQVRATVPTARLLICGGGAGRERFEALLEERGLRATVDITGPVAEADIPELLGRIDVALAPHDGRDDLGSAPLPIHEYMAAGVPIVASRVVELEVLIDDGATGLLCTPGDAGALARALELLAGNPLLRARLGSDGRAHVLRHHTWSAAAERVMTLAAALTARLPAA